MIYIGLQKDASEISGKRKRDRKGKHNIITEQREDTPCAHLWLPSYIEASMNTMWYYDYYGQSKVWFVASACDPLAFQELKNIARWLHHLATVAIHKVQGFPQIQQCVYTAFIDTKVYKRGRVLN